MKRIYSFWLILLSTAAFAQPTPYSFGDLVNELRNLAPARPRVLYVAAHPDDENTRVIAWLSRGAHAEVAYLSLTRGDGGQNLIGTELGAGLGVIRTNELMEARAIDGGRQFFSRAVDFGYSKNPEETFAIWGKEAILSDVVRVVRQFKPDIIITRFPSDGRGGHGHHTASAILAEEAFELAADPAAFPEQLADLEVWQPKVLYWNASSWWDKTLPEKAKTNPDIIEFNVGSYDAFTGYSCNELASLSRSMHKSQGFGIPVSRGEMMEYLERKKGGADFNEIIQNPSELRKQQEALLKEVEGELLAGRRIAAIEKALLLKDLWKDKASVQRIDRWIAGALGIYVEAVATQEFGVKGLETGLKAEVIARIPFDNLKWVGVNWNGKQEAFSKELTTDQTLTTEGSILLKEYTQCYWLQKPFEGRFDVETKDIGKPINDITPFVEFEISLNGKSIHLKTAVEYKWTDRVAGELSKPFVVAPALSLSFSQEQIFCTEENKTVEVELIVKAWKEGISDNILFDLPEGWSAKPAFIAVDFSKAGEEKRYKVEFSCSLKESMAVIRPRFEVYSEQVKSYQAIDYPHIKHQDLFLESKLNAVKTAIVFDKGKIGYIPGAGDKVMEALQQLGFTVDLLTEADVRNADLSKYMAILTGIRAYNTCDWLPEVQSVLMKYVEEGGNYIVQYNTSGSDLKLRSFGPYSIELGRDRVTDERAVANFVDPTHGVFNKPNKLSQADFDHWVQERGLYFASEWAPEYRPLISWNDKEEAPRLGGLLVAHYGKGAFMYTGISFFRQLPAAVPGAYKLLVNMLCYEPE
jgi:LmbE family N-acetylglucosaminyl deacetylase